MPWVNQDGVTGLTAPPGDADAFRAALARILESTELRLQMGHAARRRFLECFTHRRMVEQTTALYGRELGSSGAREFGGSATLERLPLMKRAFDVALSGVGLVLSAPVWAVAAALIKLEDGGPVFFRQERVGMRGTTFPVLKFRSMIRTRKRDHGPCRQ